MRLIVKIEVGVILLVDNEDNEDNEGNEDNEDTRT